MLFISTSMRFIEVKVYKKTYIVSKLQRKGKMGVWEPPLKYLFYFNT